MKTEQIGKGFSMKQPRTRICAFLAAIFFISGTIAYLTGDFYAMKWGLPAVVIGTALALALLVEYGVELRWRRTG